MFLILSLVTSTLFAQTLKVSDIEAKLTDNSKQWVWYKDDSKAHVSKTENYSFSPSHKVTITTGVDGTDKVTTISTSWKLTQTAMSSAASETTTSMQTTITIGTQSYILNFGSDKDHAEYLTMRPVKPVTSATSYYYSLLPR